ncbi:MAG: WXG100 family type VII secretion target [Lachnospiraceae bacterium]|nr:WXG100 family type VII secretion target [Lachnospiraceae bacterium]
MREIEVDSEILQSQINQLTDTLERTRETLNQLTERVESLQAMWNGPAHDEFNRQYELDRERMENMCQIIANIIEGMQQARIAYDQCENEVGDIVASISV